MAKKQIKKKVTKKEVKKTLSKKQTDKKLTKKTDKKTSLKNNNLVKKKDTKELVNPLLPFGILREELAPVEIPEKIDYPNLDQARSLPSVPDVIKLGNSHKKDIRAAYKSTLKNTYTKSLSKLSNLVVDFLISFFISVGIVGGIIFLSNLSKNGFSVPQLALLGSMSLIVTYILRK
jgi:hypothetical protein